MGEINYKWNNIGYVLIIVEVEWWEYKGLIYFCLFDIFYYKLKNI